MRNHGYQNYYDNEVLAASPWKLIELLYDAALDSIAAARRHLQRKDIGARALAINRALRILAELSISLNHEAGGDLSKKLGGIYRYVSRLLIEANFKQIEAPLAEAEVLISTLADAWKASAPSGPEPEIDDEGTFADAQVTEGYIAEAYGDFLHATL
jgi:flagellar protein FliS